MYGVRTIRGTQIAVLQSQTTGQYRQRSETPPLPEVTRDHLVQGKIRRISAGQPLKYITSDREEIQTSKIIVGRLSFQSSTTQLRISSNNTLSSGCS
jgi:DNA-nicking Smr family endonuclease